MSALGSPRLWAMTAFTEKAQITKQALKAVKCTSIDPSIAEQESKTRRLIMVVLLHAKPGRRKIRKANLRKSTPPVVSKSKFSGALKVVRQVRLLGADEPEHVGDAGSADVQPTVVLVRRLRARLAPLDRLHQLPGVTFCTYCHP